MAMLLVAELWRPSFNAGRNMSPGQSIRGLGLKSHLEYCEFDNVVLQRIPGMRRKGDDILADIIGDPYEQQKR